MPGTTERTRQCRTIDSRANAALLVQLLVVVMTLALSVTTLLQLYIIADMSSAAAVHTQQEYELVDSVHINTSYIGIAVQVIALIVFWVWLYRARKNVEALVAPTTLISFNPHWVVTGYFIPFANLVIPYRVVSEIWSLSSQQIRAALTHRSGDKVIGIWWGVYIVAALGERLSSWLTSRADDLEELRVANLCILAGNGIDLVLAALTALLIIRLTAIQNQAIQTMQSQPVLASGASAADGFAGLQWQPVRNAFGAPWTRSGR